MNRQRNLNDFLLTTARSIFQDIVSMDTVIMKVMNFAQKLVNADRASLFLLDSKGNELYARIFDVGTGADEAMSLDSNGQKEIRFPMDRGIAGYVATTAHVLNIEDAYTDDRFNREIDLKTGYTTKTILCMPIYIRGVFWLKMAGSALKRLMAEYKQLTINPPEGIIAGPIKEENFFEWEALIVGPDGTCFENGVFPAKLVFPHDYPLSPPKMTFCCEIFHPNIYPDGRVCISILHAPGDDPMGYETSAERWSPVQSVEKILLSVVSMLAEPNDESAANVNAAKMWREDRKQFEELADKNVRKTLGLPLKPMKS